MELEGREHYRHTANIVRFIIWDARAVVPFALLIVVKSWALLGFGVVTFVFFAVIEHYGLTLDNFVRKLRVAMGGKNKRVSHKLARYLRY
jgi:intracellular multiplication protein IcmT